MEALLLEYKTKFISYRGFKTTITDFTMMRNGISVPGLWQNRLTKDIADA